MGESGDSGEKHTNLLPTASINMGSDQVDLVTYNPESQQPTNLTDDQDGVSANTALSAVLELFSSKKGKQSDFDRKVLPLLRKSMDYQKEIEKEREELKKQVQRLKMIAENAEEFPPITSVSYAKVLASASHNRPDNKTTKHAVIIAPKGSKTNEVKSSESTKQLLKKNENLRKLAVGINSVRSTANNGVVVECRTADEAKKIEEALKEDETLEATLPKKNNPVFSFLLTGKDDNDTEKIRDELITKNLGYKICASESDDIKILNIFFTPNGNTVVTISVPPQTYKRIVDEPTLWFGTGVVKLRSRDPLTQCRGCCGFHHKIKKCRLQSETVVKFRCMRCAGNHQDTHESKCMLPIKCTNCADRNNLASKKNWRNYVPLPTDHTADDHKCPLLIAARKKAELTINYG